MLMRGVGLRWRIDDAHNASILCIKDHGRRIWDWHTDWVNSKNSPISTQFAKLENKQTNERTNEQTNKQTNKQTNEKHAYINLPDHWRLVTALGK